ncbi:MAG: adenosine deaminase [Anaerolineae bacterium]|nr:adenosine deaminase [Anaerolineae bacterium]
METLKAWPKIELHRHLEGSIRLPTLIDVARQHDIPLPAFTVEHLRPFVQMTEDDEPTFTVFLSKFNVLRQFYRSLDIIRRITREAIEDAANDNIKYMELRFTPHALARLKDFDYQDIIRAVCEESVRAETDFDIRVTLIVSVNRHESVQIAEKVLTATLALNHNSVVALDLAGLEFEHSPRPFKTLFERAQQAGLHTTVHAGEWAGPNSVREAIEALSTERVGHGVRAIEDSQVVQMVRDKAITLEVCPTSNLHSGVVKQFDQHPLNDLIYLGVPTTINTDDPSLSDITLTDELVLAHVALGLSLDVIKQNIMNAAKAAFLPDTERDALVTQFETALASAPLP